MALVSIKNLRRDRGALVGAVVFAGFFAFTSIWLHVNDVLDSNFYSGGTIYVPYHLFKAVFVFYFIWYVYYIGKLIARAIENTEHTFALEWIDKLILYFHIGAAVICLTMLVIGYLNLYYFPIALILTIPILFLSYPELASTWSTLWQKSRHLRLIRYPIHVILVTIILLFVAYIFLSKALYPTADPDTLTHYDLYYQEVMQRHGIAPNVEWYQYYYGKGSGDMFLGILLTDDQGHKVVTFCFVLSTALIVFSFAKKMSGRVSWALLASLIYLTTMVGEQQIYTRVVFGKQHVLMTALFAATIWMAMQVNFRAKNTVVRWALLTGLIAAHCVLFTPTTFFYIFPVFALYSLFHFLRREKELLKSFATVTGVILLVYVANLGINYVTTGVPEGNPFRLMWDISDQKRFSEWMSPYIQEYVNDASNASMGTIGFAQKGYSWQEWFYRIYELDWTSWLLPSVFVIALLVVAIVAALISGKRPTSPIWTVIGPPVVMLVIAAAGSTIFNQPLSMFRYYIFTTPFIVLLMLLPWQLVLDLVLKPSFLKLAYPVLALALTLGAIYHLAFNWGHDVNPPLQIRFLLGQDSFADAYQILDHYWPELAEAKSLIGNDKRIFVFHENWAVGALPGRLPEIDFHSGYKQWHVMGFGTPDEAEAAFKAEGLNYFALTVDTQGLDNHVYGVLVFSQIFSPDNIQKYMDVVYSKNGTYLLTWKGNTSHPLPWDQDFKTKWQFALDDQPVQKAIYDRLKLYYDKNHGAAYPVITDPKLPPIGALQ